MQIIAKRNILSSSYKHIIRTVSVEAHSPKPWSDIPGPSTLPVIGAVHHFMPGGQLHNLNGKKLFEKLYNTYGPIVKLEVFGKRPILFLYDAESTSQIYRGEGHTPIRSNVETVEYYRKSHKSGSCSLGLATNDIEKWQELRSIVNPVYLHPKVMKLYGPALNEVAMDVIERIKSLRDPNNRIKGNLQREISFYSLETLGVIALGCRLNCYDPNLPEDSPVHQLLEVVQNIFNTIYALEFQPRGSLWKIYPTPDFKKIMKYCELQENISKYFIDKAIEELEFKQKPDEEKGILEKLLDINKDVAYAMARDSLIAGVDTTTNSILGILYMLAVNPEKQNNLREELKTFPEQKPYLKGCIKEGMRMMPVGSANYRQTTKEYNILGYRVPANVGVTFVHEIMSTMDQYFDSPKEFIPERWLISKDDSLRYRNTDPFAFLPFGYGARSCLGRRITELEMETIIARLIENFEVGWIGPPPIVKQRLVNYMEEPLTFTFKDIKQNST